MARKKAEKTIKKGSKLYPLKRATVVGNELKPKGAKIALTVEGYKFYKQQNIV
jgi:hypothetical protein